ncbi:MAG: hypothetical protein Q9169_007354, partial [Polycauliona sp. 2 TL-2023]
MAHPSVHTHFSVKSGNLCYGELHNIWHGASAAKSHGIPVVQPQPLGTVKKHKLNHKVSAQNGTWNTYKLISTSHDQLVGWFLAHASVDVLPEIQKILRVAGSPYENTQSFSNDDTTLKKGVLVINRYDWCYYDSRGTGVVGEDKPLQTFDPQRGHDVYGIKAGLADDAEAKAEVVLWRESSEDRLSRGDRQRPHAVWLDIPNN